MSKSKKKLLDNHVRKCIKENLLDKGIIEGDEDEIAINEEIEAFLDMYSEPMGMIKKNIENYIENAKK